MDEILNWLKSGAPYISLCVIIVAIVLWKLVLKRAIIRWGGKYGSHSRGILNSVVKALLILLVVVIICEVHGIHISTIVAGLGVASVIVGLALQDTLSDVFMGVHIVSDNYFKVGDGVIYDGEEGIVCEMTLRTTKIRRISDNSVIVVSNRQVSKVVQLSNLLNIDVPLPYSEDVQKLRRVMKQIETEAAGIPSVTSCEFRGTQKFDDSATLYRLTVSCLHENRGIALRAVNGLIQDVLAENGIEIPFNQLDVHMK